MCIGQHSCYFFIFFMQCVSVSADAGVLLLNRFVPDRALHVTSLSLEQSEEGADATCSPWVTFQWLIHSHRICGT